MALTRASVTVLAVLATGVAIAPLPAQADSARKEHRAVRIEGRAPVVDGRLDDAAWEAAPVLADFVQKEPVYGVAPSDSVQVRFMYDGDALYIGARMHSANPGAIQAPVTRRDNVRRSELIQVSLDTYLDRRTAYSFGVTASGVRVDYYQGTDEEYNRDHSFDPVWEAAAQVDSLGWTAEMRIPFSQLRFNAADEQVWGMNLNRWIPSREEDVFWIPVPRGVQAWSSRFGNLTGIRGIRPSRRAELVPYVAAEGNRRVVDEDDPFAVDREGTVRVGGDARIGLGPSLTLEATVNPDFGQVEADPAEVNLSAFETFFSERRPFFTEGSRYLQAPQGWFYSRRVGAAPRVPAPGDYSDYPRSTTILGAAKLTGRTAGGLSVGALAAFTDRAEARFVEGDGPVESVEVAPRAAWGVVRLVQELGTSGSTAGMSLATVRRDLEPGSLAAAWLPRSAISGGADANLRFRNGDYTLSGYLGGAWVEGDSLAILRVQTAPAHYFQRPGRDYAVLDPSRTALSGYTTGLSFRRNNARHWLGGVGVSAVSPGMDLNEAGRMFVSDVVNATADVVYRETRPAGWYRNYEIGVETQQVYDYQGLRRMGRVSAGAEVTWSNYWSTEIGVSTNLRAQDGSAARGGPRTGFGYQYSMDAGVESPQSAPTRWSVWSGWSWGEQGNRGWGAQVELAATPGPRWEVSLEPEYRRSTDPRQFVARLPGGPVATQGLRYVFGMIERSEIAVPVRLNYTFRPDLSLELYAEPFAASGRYLRFGELPAPRSFDLDFYDAGTVVRCEPDDPSPCSEGGHLFTAGEAPVRLASDFNVRSFRSNAVLRWEWRPGSTFFLVWQQDRSARDPHGALVGPGALAESFGAAGDHFLAMKLTYWIPL